MPHASAHIGLTNPTAAAERNYNDQNVLLVIYDEDVSGPLAGRTVAYCIMKSHCTLKPHSGSGNVLKQSYVPSLSCTSRPLALILGEVSAWGTICSYRRRFLPQAHFRIKLGHSALIQRQPTAGRSQTMPSAKGSLQIKSLHSHDTREHSSQPQGLLLRGAGPLFPPRVALPGTEDTHVYNRAPGIVWASEDSSLGVAVTCCSHTVTCPRPLGFSPSHFPGHTQEDTEAFLTHCCASAHLLGKLVHC